MNVKQVEILKKTYKMTYDDKNQFVKTFEETKMQYLADVSNTIVFFSVFTFLAFVLLLVSITTKQISSSYFFLVVVIILTAETSREIYKFSKFYPDTYSVKILFWEIFKIWKVSNTKKKVSRE